MEDHYDGPINFRHLDRRNVSMMQTSDNGLDVQKCTGVHAYKYVIRKKLLAIGSIITFDN